MAAVATTFPTTDKVGFWARFAAIFIDGILLAIINSIVGGILFGGDPYRGSGLNLLIGLAYYLYFWSSYGNGQTLGMRVLKIRVVKTDGTQLDLVGALVRYIGLLISCFVLFIGVIWVAFDANKQGWHDKMANTYVVRA
ncbi:MAG: RDD family protein [Chloroflexi bacterium]|nr:RDD family protein [Chloroflexota bacterium]